MSDDSEDYGLLETIDEKGNPPEARLCDPQKAYDIWDHLREADRASSYERARIDAAYDNEQPFSQALLSANGQDYRVNVSWGFCKQVLDMSLAGYIDIIHAVQKLFKCPTTYGIPAERSELEDVVEQEVSNCIRSWRDFFPTYMRLCLGFIKHGVSIALPFDEFDWRFTATDLSDFKIARNTKIGQENIEVACCLRYYTPTQMYRMIRDPKVAEELGYNVEAIREVIIDSVNTTYREDQIDHWEKMEERFKNNDLYYSYGSDDMQMCRVVHLWVREYDGKISEYMINDSNQIDEFLYEKVGRFDDSHQAFVVFTYGPGTNGEYHGIRGQGYDVFPIHGALNIAYCQVLELATYGSAPTFQPRDESAMQELQFLPTGPYNLITPGIQVLKDSVAPNIAQNVLPVVQNFAQMFRDRTGQYSFENLINANQDKTKFQVQAELGAVAKMSMAALNLFYSPFEILLQEMVRRMKRRDYQVSEPGGEHIVSLHKRLLQRGMNGPGPHDRYLKAFQYLDVDRLSVMRAIGGGSEAARQVSMDRIMTLYGSLPDHGKQAALYDMIAETVGYRNAVRYADPPGEDETPTVDASIAQLENNQLLAGQELTILDGQNDFVHLKTHLGAEMPLIQQIQQAPDMLAQALPGINALNQHATQHIERMSMDPLMRHEASSMRQQIQQADEIIHNGLMHLQKMQRQMAKVGGNGAPPNGAAPPVAVGPDGQPLPGGGGGLDPKLEQKIRGETAYRDAKMEMLNRETEAKLARQQAEHMQKLAINDAEASQKIMQEHRA